MQSSDPAPIPDEWRHSNRDVRFRVATVAILAIAAVSVGFGLIVAVAASFTAFRYSVLFAVIMSLVAAIGVAVRAQDRDLAGVIRTADSRDSRTTEIPYSGRQFGLLVALMTCIAGTCALAAAELLLYDDNGFPGGAVFLAGFGLLCLTFPASAAMGRIGRGSLGLSEQGVTQRGWSFESGLAWNEIAGVKAGFNGHPVILLIGYANSDWRPRYTTRIWRIDRLPPVPMIEIDCRRFDVHCLDVLHYVTCYVENPGLRAELGSTAAVARAAQARPAS
jgi:hypothetical protein